MGQLYYWSGVLWVRCIMDQVYYGSAVLRVSCIMGQLYYGSAVFWVRCIMGLVYYWSGVLWAESQKPLQRGSIAAQKIWQFDGFCGNFHKCSRNFVTTHLQSFTLFCWQNCIKIYANSKFPQKLCSFVEKFPPTVALLENFYKNLLCWKVSTITCFVELFPQNIAFLQNFHKNLPS